MIRSARKAKASMSSPSMGRLLISHITLRGPELDQLYMCIADSRGIQYADLIRATGAYASDDPFGLQEATLREALNFLLVARLIEQRGPARRRATFHSTSTTANLSFSLHMARALATHVDERQRAIATLHRQLVTQDVLAMSLSDIRDEAERGPLGSMFAWTGEKVSFWTRLNGHLGLARHVARDGQVVFVPRTDMVLAALRYALGELSTKPLTECLDTIDRTFFACYTRRSAVHRGLAQTLVALHRLGAIRLSHSSDARQSLLLGDWRVSDVTLIADKGGKA